MSHRNALLDPLKALTPVQYKELVFRIDAPVEYLPSDNTAQTVQAVDLLTYAEQRPELLHTLTATLATIQGRPALALKHADISRLPRPSAELVGRGEELRTLDRALFDAKIHLAILVAGGGVGKSALSFAWLKAMQPDYHGCKVFAWSFYSQGSHETQTSAAEFFQAALAFFGVTEIPKDDVDKGRTLARCVARQKVLLILDGLEPLQHPAHILDGELKDTGLKAFYDDLYAHGAAGLVLVSSRQPLVELGEWDRVHYRAIELDTLPTADGAALLRNLGVNGADAELKKTCGELGGHALALVLLGKLLARAFGGRIERRDCLPPLWEEAKKGGHALRVLKFYEDLVDDGRVGETSFRFAHHKPANGGQQKDAAHPTKAFMFLLGLFDRPMGLRERKVLLAEAHCAAPLRALDDFAWTELEQQLEQAGLLLKPQDWQSLSRTHWDCHPLIRAYFGKRFAETQPEQFRQAQRVLFEYYQSVPDKPQPDTLAELEPLYRAVVHGCLAGEFQKALVDVYRERIRRGDEGYSIHKLGAYSQDLTALAAFFPHGWTQPVQQGLNEANQAWLLAEASFCLMSLGRLAEAVEPRVAHQNLSARLEDWKEASIAAQNLVDLYLPLGKLTQAEAAARQAVGYAEQAEDLAEQRDSHAYLGHCLHRQGELAAASFQSAEQLQGQRQADKPQLYSLPGFLYCALLLDQADDASAAEAVVGRAEALWEMDKTRKTASRLDLALDLLTLARAHWRLDDASRATDDFQQAVAGIRKAGQILLLPIFLIDRANFSLHQGELKKAKIDLDEAGGIIRRCGMKLYQVDWHLAMARYIEQHGNAAEAGKHREHARALIEVTGYKLRLSEAGFTG